MPPSLPLHLTQLPRVTLACCSGTFISPNSAGSTQGGRRFNRIVSLPFIFQIFLETTFTFYLPAGWLDGITLGLRRSREHLARSGPGRPGRCSRAREAGRAHVFAWKPGRSSAGEPSTPHLLSRGELGWVLFTSQPPDWMTLAQLLISGPISESGRAQATCAHREEGAATERCPEVTANSARLPEARPE